MTYACRLPPAAEADREEPTAVASSEKFAIVVSPPGFVNVLTTIPVPAAPPVSAVLIAVILISSFTVAQY